MAKPYPQELREAIIEAVAARRTPTQVAKDFEVGIRTVTRLLERWRATGDVRAKRFGGYKTSILKPHEAQIRRWLRAQPDLTLKALRARLLKQGVAISKSAIARFLDRLYPEKVAARAWRKELDSLLQSANIQLAELCKLSSRPDPAALGSSSVNLSGKGAPTAMSSGKSQPNRESQ